MLNLLNFIKTCNVLGTRVLFILIYGHYTIKHSEKEHVNGNAHYE